MSVTQLKTSRESEEWQLRVDLAAAFRLTVEMNWHEGVGNHFSAAVSADGKQFLMNRKWRHFSTIRASDLQLLDADDDSIMKTPEAPDVSAWAIHGGIHASVAHARVLLHLHPPYATAIASPRRSGDQADRAEHRALLQPPRHRPRLHRHRRGQGGGQAPRPHPRQQAHHDDGQPRRAVRRADRRRSVRGHVFPGARLPDPGAGLFHRPEAQHHAARPRGTRPRAAGKTTATAPSPTSSS